MPPLLTFIIPVRHPENARDWAKLRAVLTETAGSIAAQTMGDWRALVVANHGADLPPLPAGFEIVRVDFPPNRYAQVKDGPKETVYDSFRFDKGRRVLAGMLRQRDSRYFMVVDEDDFVTNQLVAHVAKTPTANGWEIHRGYVWTDGGRVLLTQSSFSTLCGTCLIIRSDLYQLPARLEDAAAETIKTMFGSHRFIAGLLTQRNTPLTPLPFPGAIYRIGHGGTVTGKTGIFAEYFNLRLLSRRPHLFFANLLRLRWVTSRVKREFFGR